MTRDPFHRQIVARLNGHLDPEAFERCAVSLLRAVYPALVPVRGGSDGGMDGACGDGLAAPFPLVTTTAVDVQGNLRRSLRSYRKSGGKRRKAVVATSRELTPAKRAALEKAAKALGFTLVNVHTQAAMADLLYRSPQWCRDLLSLASGPLALSALPGGDRPAPTSALVGRDAELAWLRGAAGDLLLVGQPGSGKTALLSALARDGVGLFVVTDDDARIADGVREQGPAALLVDDAHLRPGLLGRLRRWRADARAEFRIIADCWPGERDAVMKALGVTTNSARELGPLTRKEVVSVIRGCGVNGPNDLMHELVRQADGRPGLAVTLCQIWLREGGREIALAEALCRDVRTTFTQLVGREAVTALAAFAVGGERGMPIGAVARELGESLLQTQTLAARLASGGVLTESGGGRLAVRPEALRHALVRDTFFGGPARLPIDGLLALAPDPEAALRTLIGASARGGDVGFGRLTSMLREVGCEDETWEAFAALGEGESRWVLREHPARLMAVARAALHHVPEDAILALLAAEARDGRRGDGPLERVKQWAEAGVPGTGEPSRRRRLVADAASAWLDAGRDPDVGVRAACVALSPQFRRWESDPGNAYGLTHSYGFAAPCELAEVRGLWPEILGRLPRPAAFDWSPLKSLVRSWGWPGSIGVPLRTADVKPMVGFARRLLRDLYPLARERASSLHWAHWTANVLDAKLPGRLPPDFAALYPPVLVKDWERETKEQHAAALALAERWLAAGPGENVRLLAAWEADLNGGGGRVWPCWSRAVCERIAAGSPSPGAWAAALSEAGAGGELVEPFLRRSAEAGEPGWEGRLAEALDDPARRGAAFAVVLAMASPPPSLLQGALGRAPGLAGVAWSLCANGSLPEARVLSLMTHTDAEVACQAAAGEWMCDPPETVRPGLRAAWHAALVRSPKEPPAAAFRLDDQLAHDWLAARYEENPVAFWQHGHAAEEAYAALSAAQREGLLALLPERAVWVGEAARLLVGDDVSLYRSLLADPRLRPLHLKPLHGRPEGVWVAKALAALDAGHVAEDVAGAALRPWDGRFGPASARWQECEAHFTALEAHPDGRVSRVGRAGRRLAERRLGEALRRERLEEVQGG